jgi:hypothetical protein
MPRIALKITILGASGFIGRHLTAHLRKRGDTVIEGRLREATSAAKECEGSDVVVNLAGAPAAARWTAAYKDEIRRSRAVLPPSVRGGSTDIPKARGFIHMTKLKVGDHVRWNSEAGHVSGRIVKVHTPTIRLHAPRQHGRPAV